MEILTAVTSPIPMTKILFSKSVIKADEQYFNIVLPKKMKCNLDDINKIGIAREFKVLWKTVF